MSIIHNRTSTLKHPEMNIINTSDIMQIARGYKGRNYFAAKMEGLRIMPKMGKIYKAENELYVCTVKRKCYIFLIPHYKKGRTNKQLIYKLLGDMCNDYMVVSMNGI